MQTIVFEALYYGLTATMIALLGFSLVSGIKEQGSRAAWST